MLMLLLVGQSVRTGCEEFQRLTGSDDDTATDDTAALALSATAMLLCHVSKPLRTPQFCL